MQTGGTLNLAALLALALAAVPSPDVAVGGRVMGRPVIPTFGGVLFDADFAARVEWAQLQVRLLPLTLSSGGTPGVSVFALPGLDLGGFACGFGVHATWGWQTRFTPAWALRFGTAAGGHFSLLVAHSGEDGPGIDAVDTELQLAFWDEAAWLIHFDAGETYVLAESGLRFQTSMDYQGSRLYLLTTVGITGFDGDSCTDGCVTPGSASGPVFGFGLEWR